MRTGSLVALVVSAALVLLSAQAGATLTYRIVDLGTLGGVMSRGYAVNESGQVAGVARDASAAFSAAYWNGGPAAQTMGSLGGSAGEAHAINDDGWATGWSSRPGSMYGAFLWKPDPVSGAMAMTDLGFNGWGRDISNSGAIVGQWYSSSTQAYLWENMEDGPVALPTETGVTESQATGINDSGVITGWTYASGYRAVQWSNDSGHTCVSLAGLGGSLTQALDINASGSMVGWGSPVGSTPYHACFWQDPSTVLDLGTLGGTESQAFALNRHNTVVGTARVSSNYHRAFVWEGSGSLVNLNTLVDPSTPGWTLECAYDINDNGQIVGSGLIGGQEHAFLANPSVPEPASCALLALAVSGVGAVLRRRRRR
jgi:probable HAF family extracellular repeat protein